LEEQGCWLKTAVEGQTLTIHAIIGAFDASLGKVLKAIVVWTLKKGEEHKPQRLRKKAN
jgi:hypothetical protein